MLFNIIMELLGETLRVKLSGITIDSPFTADCDALILKMFADDTTIFFSPEDIPALLEILRKWTEASGLKFHQRKTQVLWLGAKEGSKDNGKGGRKKGRIEGVKEGSKDRMVEGFKDEKKGKA